MTDPPTTPLPIAPGAAGRRWLLEVAALVALALGIVVVARAWDRLPAVVPMHFDLAGEPDGWGGRKSLLLLPATSVFLYLLLSVVQHIPASWYNYSVAITDENRERQYRLARDLILSMKAAITGLFAHLTVAVVRTAVGEASGLGPWLIFGWLAVILGLVGLYLVRAARAR